MSQLSLFDDPGMEPVKKEKIADRVEQWEETRLLRPQFSKAERKSLDAFLGLMMWVFTSPVTTYVGRGGVGKMYNEMTTWEAHRNAIITERFVTVFKLLKEAREAEQQAIELGQAEDIWTKLVNDWKAATDRMTNREVCLVMCDASLEAPLDTESTAEYMRAFAATYGIDQYDKMFGGEYPELLSYEKCKHIRYVSGLGRRLPELDVKWLQEFNAELQRRANARRLGEWKVKEAENATAVL